MAFARSHRGEREEADREAALLRLRATRHAQYVFQHSRLTGCVWINQNSACFRRDVVTEGTQAYWQTVMNKFTFTIPLRVRA